MSDQQLEMKLASQLSKLIEDDDDDQQIDESLFTQSPSKVLDKNSLMHQRSILDDFANGFVPQQIFANDLDEDRKSTTPSRSTDETSEQNHSKNGHQSQQLSKQSSFKDVDFQTELDQLGQLDVDQLDNILSLADNLAVKLAYRTSMKMKNIKTKVQSQYNSEKVKITKQFMQRKRILEKYMNRAPIVRLMDKIFFIIGVLLVIATTFMLGRYPNTHYYRFHIYTVITLVAIRLFHYRLKKWHYYLFDFCYFANTLIIYFILVDPKNDILFRVFFVYANGPFGLAIPAFKNSMIFHKLDNLTSIAIHIIPLITSWNLRWTTIEHESQFPEEERYFISINESNEVYSSQFFYKMFFIPFALYLLWAILYFIKVFVISSKKITEKNYETMYIYYMNQAGPRKILSKFGQKLAPFVFMTFHIVFFVISSFLAILAFGNFYIHTFLMLLWTTMSIWNGANFYMEYFSRKYESNLKMLEQIEQQLTTNDDSSKNK
eukprot:403356560